MSPAACECRGYGPHARRDGARYDSAGLDFPCPDRGTTARQATLRLPAVQVIDDRTLAIEAVLRCRTLHRLAVEMPDEPIESLAATIVDTAHRVKGADGDRARPVGGDPCGEGGLGAFGDG